MHKRTEPDSQDMWSQGNHYGKNNQQCKEDSQNNSLEYFINRQKTIRLLRQKGIKYLYPIQQKTFRIIHSGSDIIARDRTGSGKTMAFVLPVIQRFREQRFEHRYPKFLIILPTRQLAIQVFNQIQSLRYRDEDDFKSYVVYGKTSIEQNIRRMSEGIDILVATPGRLNDLVQRGAVRLDSIKVICLDEADQILKQGFKQQIQKVFSGIAKVNKNKIQTLLFSATIPQWLQDLSYEYQSKDTPYINMISDDDIRTSKTIKHMAVEVTRLGQMEIAKLIQQMVDKYGGYEKRILIFCDKKADVNNLSKNLRIQNQPLHGDVAQSRRQYAYRNFKAGLLKCIVATNVAARGLDFPHVDLVVQTSPPLNTQQYIHRAGRTGRAGKQGACLTLFDRTKSRLVYKIQNEAKIFIEQIKLDMDKLFNSNREYRDYGRNDGYGRDQREERSERGGDRYERNGDRYERNDGGSRYQRNDYNRNERNDSYRNQRNRDYERGQRRDDRNSYQSNNRYGDRENSNYNRDQRRSSNYDINQNRDPRQRYTVNKPYREQNNIRQRSRSTSPVKQSRQRKRSVSRSNSRSKSPQKQNRGSTSPRRSSSPRKDVQTKTSIEKKEGSFEY